MRANAGIRGVQNPRRCARKHYRLTACSESGDLVVFLVPRLNAVPPKAVVQREVRVETPTVLRVSAEILIAAVKRIELALVILTGCSKQKVGKIAAGFATRENKTSIELGNRVDVHLVIVRFSSQF